MSTLANIDLSVLYCMFKGAWGTRKSTAALSFPTPQYWFSYDRKMNSLILPMNHFGIKPTDISFDDYRDYDACRKKLEDFQGSCPYKTIVIDSVSSFGDSVLRQTIDRKEGMVRKAGKSAGKMIGGIDVPEIEDFNAESAALLEMMSLTKDLNERKNINIVLIAHVITIQSTGLDGVSHIDRTIVTAGKKVSHKIPAYCDEVYHFEVEGDNYTVKTQNNGFDFARTSLPLDKKITMNDKRLYDEFLIPAVEKLKNQPPSIRF